MLWAETPLAIHSRIIFIDTYLCNNSYDRCAHKSAFAKLFTKRILQVVSDVCLAHGNTDGEQAEHAEKAYGYVMKEDAGRGYRRVVASPKPVEIVEQDAINSLVDANKIVICCGGGGIPVTLQGDHLKGASAVIDKDFASCLLAKELDADMLIILTAVEKVAVNFGKENEKWLDEMTVEEAQKYVDEGQFAPGSMLPKVQAAMDFASSKEGRSAMITLLEKAKDGIQGKTGTKVHI